MSASDIGTWIGTLFSIIGAAIAIWQARVASSAADRAEKVRKEIAAKYVHGDLSGVDFMLSAALKAMDKYGPGRSANSLRGSSPLSDADAVRQFTAALDRHRDMLTSTLGEHCYQSRDRLNTLLAEFGAAINSDDRLRSGCAIYLEITLFSGIFKKALDNRVFGGADKIA